MVLPLLTSWKTQCLEHWKIFLNVHLLSKEGIWLPELLVHTTVFYFLLPTEHCLVHEVLVDYVLLHSSGNQFLHPLSLSVLSIPFCSLGQRMQLDLRAGESEVKDAGIKARVGSVYNPVYFFSWSKQK